MLREFAGIAVAALLVRPGPAAPPPRIEALFFTASWCGPCRAVKPVLERLEKKYPREFHVTPVDFDAARDMAAQWEVHDIPVVIVFDGNGKALLRADGSSARTLENLEAGVARAIERARAERRRK
jgi:thioredoxin-like negative regulator of GroEL